MVPPPTEPAGMTVLPFMSCTEALGATPTLCVLTVTVQVMFVPATTDDGRPLKVVVVGPGVMLIAFVGEALAL